MTETPAVDDLPKLNVFRGSAYKALSPGFLRIDHSRASWHATCHIWGRERAKPMCLAVPGKIIETANDGLNRIGRVQFGGISRQVCMDFVPEAQVGDYVLVHVGFAISKVGEEQAKCTYELLRSMEDGEQE
jgi:hydrogenase expression/formation protein HypC